MSALDVLIGTTINQIAMNDRHDIMRVTYDNVFVRFFETEGDCCSTSWFEEIFNIDALIGGKVQAVEDIPDMPEAPNPLKEDQLYGIKVTTSKGTAKIVFRNSSNGYYGGYIQECTPKYCARVEFEPVTTDTLYTEFR